MARTLRDGKIKAKSKGRNYTGYILIVVFVAIAILVLLTIGKLQGPNRNSFMVSDNETGFTENYCRELMLANDSRVADMNYVENNGFYRIQKLATIESADDSIFFHGSRIIINLYSGSVEKCLLDRLSNASLIDGAWTPCQNNTQAKLSTAETDNFLYVGYETSENPGDVMKDINGTEADAPELLKRIYSSEVVYVNPDLREVYDSEIVRTKGYLSDNYGCDFK